ncbi:MAG: hypothetical protein AB7I33_13415 [Gemmatimonadales bacterium]
MRVAVLFDPGGEHWDKKDIAAVVDGAKVIRRHIRRLGHEATLVPIRPNDWRYISRIRRCDLVFNLCEGLDGHSRYEDWVVGTLELTGVPYTGCRPWATSVCHRKHMANVLLAANGIPVPRSALAKRNQIPDGLAFPVIVKPANEDASLGIDNGAVCTSIDDLKRRIALMSEQYDSVMVQEFVDGREFNVGFVGKTMLPLSEISFADMPEGYWHIVSYAAKWDEGSPEDRGTIPQCPARVPEDLARKLTSVARAAWEMLCESEGYGRVDLRVDRSGQVAVIEVNPNPDISEDAGLARMAQAYGWDYTELTNRVMNEALERAASRKAGQAGRPQMSGAV